MINQVWEEKDAALTTGQSIPAPKDGKELVNSEEGTTKDATINPPEPLAEQQDIDLKFKIIGKMPEDEKKARKLVLGKSQFEIKDGVL